MLFLGNAKQVRKGPLLSDPTNIVASSGTLNNIRSNESSVIKNSVSLNNSSKPLSQHPKRGVSPMGRLASGIKTFSNQVKDKPSVPKANLSLNSSANRSNLDRNASGLMRINKTLATNAKTPLLNNDSSKKTFSNNSPDKLPQKLGGLSLSHKNRFDKTTNHSTNMQNQNRVVTQSNRMTNIVKSQTNKFIHDAKANDNRCALQKNPKVDTNATKCLNAPSNSLPHKSENEPPKCFSINESIKKSQSIAGSHHEQKTGLSVKESDPSKAESNPSKGEAASSKGDSNPSKVESGPSKTESNPSKEEAASSKGVSDPSKEESVQSGACKEIKTSKQVQSDITECPESSASSNEEEK